jgi:hypothetical protein
VDSSAAPGPHPAVRRLAVAAALWRVGEVPAADVVAAAVDLVVAGLGGEAVDELAGVPAARAVAEVPELLGPACHELGLPVVERETPQSLVVATAATCARLLAGELTEVAVASWVHRRHGHDGPDADAVALAELSDRYGILEYDESPTAEVDAAVRAIAARLAPRLYGPTT